MPEKPVVLVVEDEPHIQELLHLHLGLEGLECVGVADGREALRIAAERPVDLVILDLMIPGMDGLTVCKALRRQDRTAEVPILMLTARREEADKVLGLESGADDYLTKPFGVRELVARVRALRRRARPKDRPAALGAGAPPVEPGAAPEGLRRPFTVRGVEIDLARRRVRVDGREVELTAQEFNLLHLLASHPGIVFSRDALLTRIWKGETYVTERSVDTLVKRLRRKIERDSREPERILTVWGAGYRFADADT